MNTPETDGPARGAQPTDDPLRSPMALRGEGGSFEPAEDSAASKIPSGAAVLVLVMLVGGGAIMLMRQFGLGGGYKFDDITIDYPMDAMEASDRGGEYEQVITDLTNHDVPQVSLKELRDEPFQLRGAAPKESFTSTAFESEADRLARERQARLLEVQREFQKLELNSVIGGSAPIARVSGVPVRPGDTVNGVFTVRRITGRSVELEAEGRVYMLTMGR